MRKGEVDLHYVVTRILNVRLSEFFVMAEPKRGKIIEIIQTGGLKEILSYKETNNPIFPYAAWLLAFRDGLWEDSEEDKMNKNVFKEQMSCLFSFYRGIPRRVRRSHKKLTRSLELCFRDIDEYFEFPFFSNMIDEAKRRYALLTTLGLFLMGLGLGVAFGLPAIGVGGSVAVIGFTLIILSPLIIVPPAFEYVSLSRAQRRLKMV